MESMKKDQPPTYAQLHRLLIELEFTIEQTEAHLQVYRHAASDTLIVLASHVLEEPVRDADLISIRKHLIEKGIIDEHALARKLKSASIGN
jgi:hypothetical protein